MLRSQLPHWDRMPSQYQVGLSNFVVLTMGVSFMFLCNTSFAYICDAGPNMESHIDHKSQYILTVSRSSIPRVLPAIKMALGVAIM